MHLYFLFYLFLSISISVTEIIPTPQYINGFDLSAPQSGLPNNKDFWLCTRNAGFQKVILRGFKVLSVF